MSIYKAVETLLSLLSFVFLHEGCLFPLYSEAICLNENEKSVPVLSGRDQSDSLCTRHRRNINAFLYLLLPY